MLVACVSVHYSSAIWNVQYVAHLLQFLETFSLISLKLHVEPVQNFFLGLFTIQLHANVYLAVFL